MSRRDTIIIAVLVNAGLMALLFMLAINTEGERISDRFELSQSFAEPQRPVVPEPAAAAPIVLADLNGTDEVDAFLKDLVITEYAPGFGYEENILEVASSPVAIAKQPPAAPPAEISSKQPDNTARYVDITVKRGDALEKIARHNGTTVEAIKKANNLTSTKLSIGQVLRVPVSPNAAAASVAEATQPAKKAAPVETKPAASAVEPQYYTIKSGDNPWKIAKQFQVRFDDLLKLNDLDEEKARSLKVGDKIRVR